MFCRDESVMTHTCFLETFILASDSIVCSDSNLNLQLSLVIWIEEGIGYILFDQQIFNNPHI